MSRAVTRVELDLCRSDQGDGGWSLHLPGREAWVLSGRSGVDAAGDWSRPDERDYLLAAYLVAAGKCQGVDTDDVEGFGGELYSVREIMLRAGAPDALADEAQERLEVAS